jgi:uncharacterized membrane protein
MQRVWRGLRGRPRELAALVIMVAAGWVMPGVLSATTRAILAWDVGILIFLVLSAQLFVTARSDEMPAAAEAQQEGEWTIFLITLGVVVASFVAVGSEFASIKDAPASERVWRISFVAVTLFLSWLVSHVTFTYRYAHEYYSRDLGGKDVDGGLDFPGKEDPDYLDFFYFALVLGMTFQVSDVDIISRKLRRVATLHGLLSFLFNTVIVAFTVNIAAGLMG